MEGRRKSPSNSESGKGFMISLIMGQLKQVEDRLSILLEQLLVEPVGTNQEYHRIIEVYLTGRPANFRE